MGSAAKKAIVGGGTASHGFSGSVGTSGNSRSFRLEKAFFSAAPEFGAVGSAIRADIIGPGTFIVRIDTPARAEEADPVIGAWLSFIDGDIVAHPEQLVGLVEAEASALERLVGTVVVDDSDRLPDDVTF